MPNPFRGIWVALPAAVDAPDLEGCALYSSPPFPAGGETARGSGRSESLCRCVFCLGRSRREVPCPGPAVFTAVALRWEEFGVVRPG